MEVSPIYVVLGLVGAVLAFTVWIVMSPTDEGVPLRPPAAAAAEAAVPVPLREFTVEGSCLQYTCCDVGNLLST